MTENEQNHKITISKLFEIFIEKYKQFLDIHILSGISGKEVFDRKCILYYILKK